ncbi:MAG: hypothetical protein Q7S27_03215 [Nanoarchaeota archaeon]|nr:hypothetical protein [Nanoarchaeota archaeon]
MSWREEFEQRYTGHKSSDLAFELLRQDHLWFLRNREMLTNKYVKGYVAILESVVLHHDNDEELLLRKVYETYGVLGVYLARIDGPLISSIETENILHGTR